MSYGISITNNSNFLLINDTYEIYSVYQSGFFSADGAGDLVIPSIDLDETLFVRNVTADAVLGLFIENDWVTPSISNGQGYAFTLSGSGLEKYPNAVFEYVKLKKAPLVGEDVSQTYGLQIFKSNGDLVFSTRHYHALLSAVITLSAAQVIAESSLDIALPTLLTGKNRYFNVASCSLFATLETSDTGAQWKYKAMGLSANGATLYTRYRWQSSFNNNLVNGGARTIGILDY